MTEDEVIQTLLEYFESLFPKICPNCNRSFLNLREYILNTTRIGVTISYDAEDGNWDTERPVGTVALASCPCGSTMALTTESMELAQRLELLDWVRGETQRRGIRPAGLLELIRNKIRKCALE
jgi:hypothetical protein